MGCFAAGWGELTLRLGSTGKSGPSPYVCVCVCVCVCELTLRLGSTRKSGPSPPPWRQPMGKWMVSLVNFHTNATRIGWHMWEIDLKFAPGLPSGWLVLPPFRSLVWSEHGTHTTVKARLWPWLSVQSPSNLLSCSPLARKLWGQVPCRHSRSDFTQSRPLVAL